LQIGTPGSAPSSSAALASSSSSSLSEAAIKYLKGGDKMLRQKKQYWRVGGGEGCTRWLGIGRLVHQLRIRLKNKPASAARAGGPAGGPRTVSAHGRTAQADGAGGRRRRTAQADGAGGRRCVPRVLLVVFLRVHLNALRMRMMTSSSSCLLHVRLHVTATGTRTRIDARSRLHACYGAGTRTRTKPRSCSKSCP
jgi:hypothetical protein